MALFALNEDVLSLILTELTQQDARQLLTTCHAGYDSAMPYFLRKVEFNEWSRSRTLAPAERIRVFCEFMLADPDRRIPCLRVLWLDGFAFAETSARMGQSGWERSYSCPCHLSRVLRLATGLRELSLRHADELLAAVDRDCFFDALAALPSLDIIRLDGQPSACELLSRTMSRPRNLRVSSGGGTRPHRSGAFTGVHLPANLSECLLELHFLGSVILAENLYPAGIVFPRLRTLTARFGFCASLANIAGAFPNLCTLNLHKVTFAVDQPPAIWPSGLDCVRLEADPGLTPALPLACRVRRLELITAITQSENQPFFATLLNSLTPAILFLAVKHANVAPLTTEIPHVASGLKYLHLVLRSLDEELVVRVLSPCVVETPSLTTRRCGCCRQAVRWPWGKPPSSGSPSDIWHLYPSSMTIAGLRRSHARWGSAYPQWHMSGSTYETSRLTRKTIWKRSRGIVLSVVKGIRRSNGFHGGGQSRL